MPAAHLKFSRAEFSAAAGKKQPRSKEKLAKNRRLFNGLLALFFGGVVVAHVLLKLLKDAPEWIQVTVGVTFYSLSMGPLLVWSFYFNRRDRTFGKCPNCHQDAIEGSNASYILATGKCGCCGYEVLEHEDCLEPAITAVPPSVEFKKLSLADFTTRSLTARKGDGRRVFTFTLLYLAGLSPLLWHLYSAAQQSILPSRQFVALLVAWLFLSPVLWSKLSRWLFGREQFPSCPDCHAAWEFPRESMTIRATGRCGHCGVQVLEENEDAPPTARSGSDNNIPRSVEQNKLSGEVQLLSRSKFMALFREDKDTREAARSMRQKDARLTLGSSLAVLIGSILFLPGRSAVLVPLGWFFAVMFFSERRLKRQKWSKADATLEKCPFCENSNESSRYLIITTGRCERCLNVILQDDLGQELKAAD